MNVARRRIKLEDNSYERNKYNVLRESRSSDYYEPGKNTMNIFGQLERIKWEDRFNKKLKEP